MGSDGWVLRAILRAQGDECDDDRDIDLSHLSERLRDAERAAAAAIRERDRLRREVLGARVRIGRKPPRRRRPPEAGLPVPAVPPRGPLPLQGGAEAPLEFDS
jgi:hypothetical protein